MFIGPSLFHYRVIIQEWTERGKKQRQQTSNPLTPEQEKSHKPNPDQLRDTISCRKNTNKWFFFAAEYGKKIIRTTEMASKSTQELWSPPYQATCLLKIAQVGFLLFITSYITKGNFLGVTHSFNDRLHVGRSVAWRQ